MVFLDQLRAHGHDRGLLMMPGSTADFNWYEAEFAEPPAATDQVEAIFTTGKSAYIAD